MAISKGDMIFETSKPIGWGRLASRAMLAGNGDRRGHSQSNKTGSVWRRLFGEKACAQGTWLTLDTLVNVDL